MDNQSKVGNNANNQNKILSKNKTDMIKNTNNFYNLQKSNNEASNFELIDGNPNLKKLNKQNLSINTTNKNIIPNNNFNINNNANTHIVNNYPNLEKNLHLSNTQQDLAKNFTANGIKKKEISNLSILSPKAQKEILNNKVKNANFQENLFQKNINLDLNTQNFDTSIVFVIIIAHYKLFFLIIFILA